MEHFETQYPINSREKEIKAILNYAAHGQSCQLISPPGAGRSTVIRLLAFHPKLVKYHLASQGLTLRGYLFVYVNFAEIPNFETGELIKFLFLSLLTALEENKKLHSQISLLFKEALKLNDPLVIFQNFKKSILTIEQSNNVTIVFLFDRFSEFADKIAPDFYSSLYSLRIGGGRVPIVLSTHRPLKELLPENIIKTFYEFFVENLILLEPYDEVANNFRIAVLEKEYARLPARQGKKLSPAVKKEIIRLTGGHSKLMKLSAQIILSETDPSLTRRPLARLLLSHNLIENSLLEIWQSLPVDQQSKPLFPLYDQFVKQGIPQTLLPKTVRLNESSNEIYFGDEALADLTAQEFKLLKFLIDNPRRVVERNEVINAVWSDSKTQAGVSDEALDQMVHRLRRKIEDEADNPKHLLTVKGRGFRFLP